MVASGVLSYDAWREVGLMEESQAPAMARGEGLRRAKDNKERLV